MANNSEMHRWLTDKVGGRARPTCFLGQDGRSLSHGGERCAPKDFSDFSNWRSPCKYLDSTAMRWAKVNVGTRKRAVHS
jgi:hypothetical protein